MTEETEILIAGAGIAGLTAALALAQRGCSVTVVDAFEEPSEVGAGLQVAPNASRILRTLGVLDALVSKAIAPEAIRLGDGQTGDMLLEMPITPAWLERMDAPYLTAHRAALHSVLYTAAVANPAITLKTGHAVADVREDGEHVTTVLKTADGEAVIVSRLLIGADGIWSRVRESVPGAAQPQATGRIAWRAIGPASGNGPNVTAWMIPNGHIVTYPVRNADTLNVVAITQGRSEKGDWAQTADADMLVRLLGTTHPIRGFEGMDKAHWTTWPLNAVAPEAPWNSGRILLIGDAAHGMEPFAAQGAAMAIEDGFAAGICLANAVDNPTPAFARYDGLRRGRVRKVAKRTEFNRWVYHQSGPGRTVRNFLFSKRSPQSFLSDLDWLYGYRIPE
ncbi:FAD-dependent oxidoreductase [Oricola sp.]|uniref:FAD-dependent oxidoreductase n=1 Tax=Oricola sp. TaxID=1979950 RepID=UPI0025F833D8|nr:FAD-dependent oxidoreductase [Oricola sp.]MCI5077031.1 FAD-dependent oxidoreductase [Oricola sp.]